MSRLGRTFKAGRLNIPPFLSATSLFHRPLGLTDTVAADQSPAGMLANAINYANQSYAHWYGYTGPGYGNANWPFSIGFDGPGSGFGAPIYAVRPSVASQNITFHRVTSYFGTSPNYHLTSLVPQLAAAIASVPIPDKTLCPRITGSADIWSDGTDQYYAVWNLDTDEWWDFWEFSNNKPDVQAFTGTTWNCGYPGYIPNVSTSTGTFPYNGGARATSLSLAGGVITLQDLRDVQAGGSIDHALCFASGINALGGSAVAPATRFDGRSGGNAFPSTIPTGFPNAGAANPAFNVDNMHEAQRFRFPAGTTASAGTSVTSYPLGREICRAIEKYGFYDVDTTGGVAIFMEDDRTIGSPYHLQGPGAAHPWDLTWPGGDPRWGGTPSGGWNSSTGYTVLNNLPWNQLQALDPISA